MLDYLQNIYIYELSSYEFVICEFQTFKLLFYEFRSILTKFPTFWKLFITFQNTLIYYVIDDKLNYH